jgi:uncharacterized protein (TIGR02117 family)
MLTLLFKYVKRLLSLVFLMLLLYVITAYILWHIPVQAEPTTEAKSIKIFIKSNGVHTDVVVPANTKYKNWLTHLPFANTKAADSTYQYLAFGWGDKGFYLHTKNWADLKMSVAFKAITGLSTTAIHATYYQQLDSNAQCVPLYLSATQYVALVQYIHVSFTVNSKGSYIAIPTNNRYGIADAFYEAKGTYSLLYTCNTWANAALKACGQKACLWTPLSQPIFNQYL